ncbi:MAG TPA: hypothetical protein VMV49_10545 [Candidatus Deferrimicrobium sp.]|nr:hypothetical protein [Candidatus Deferrimicrobium sp.]
MDNKFRYIFIITALVVALSILYVPPAKTLIIPIIDPGTYQYDSNESPKERVTGIYSTTGENLTVFVCNASIFTSWSASPTGIPSGTLWSRNNSYSGGDFDFLLPDSGTYYVVFSNMEGVSQSYVTFSIIWVASNIPGFEVGFLLIGILGLLVAIPLKRRLALESEI